MATTSTFTFTRPKLDALPVPAVGERLVVRDAKVQGLELRVTSTGAKAFSLRRRIKGGKVERVTIGSYPSVSIEVARDKAKVIDAQHAVGVSAAGVARRQKGADRTFAESLTAFVDDSSTRDAPLKPRTRQDYLQMIRPAGEAKNGRQHVAGELYAIADRKIEALTGAGIKALHKRLSDRSVTRANYAMRVARAVLKYEGVRMEDDPFDQATRRRDRIVIPASKARDRIIPVERIEDWWSATTTARNGDLFQLLLLTGMRRGEMASVCRKDFDERGARLHLRDTKNGKPHTILLSRQAAVLVAARFKVTAEEEPLPLGAVIDKAERKLAGIRSAKDEAGDTPLFASAANPRKSAKAVIDATGIEFSAHDCRRTFATIAAARLPGYVVKRLLNHSAGNDVTAAHYVHLDEATLRNAWQVVADAVAPGTAPADAPQRENVVTLGGRRFLNAAGSI